MWVNYNKTLGVEDAELPEPQSFVELTTYREIWRCSHTVSHEIVVRAPLSRLGLQRLLGKPNTTDVLFLFDTGLWHSGFELLRARSHCLISNCYGLNSGGEI